MALTLASLDSALLAKVPLPEAWRPHRSSSAAILRSFGAHFRGSASRRVLLGFVPGRIEVLGRHTDYCGGHTLVCALDRGFLFVAGPNDRGTIRMVEDRPEFAPLEFPLSPRIEPSLGDWANYPMTMARRLAANFAHRGAGGQLRGVDIAFASDLPLGSGMSGSSALMMMSYVAIAEVNDLRARPRFQREIRDGIDLATYLACCENGQTFRGLAGGRGVGTFGGSEDHTAILNCRADRLSLFRYAPTVFRAEIAWPEDCAFAVAFSGVRAEKTRQALERYNLASLRAREATAGCNRAWGTRLASLREVLEHAEAECGRGAARAIAEALAKTDRKLDLAGRVRQFLLEERMHMPGAVSALARGDRVGFGVMVTASHDAARRYLRNIVRPIDDLAKTALRLGALGSSGFGGGFGGSLFAVVARAGAEEFLERWRASYAAAYRAEAAEAEFFLARPSDGIRIWDGERSGRYVDSVFGGIP